MSHKKLFVAVGVVGVVGCGEPDTVIDTRPPALANVARSVFVFHAEDAASEFVCTVDDTTEPCASPFTVDLADGTHHFEVASVDDPTPATHDWRIDATPPETTITAGPPPLDNVIHPVIEFTGSADAVRFECQVDALPFVPCASPFSLIVADGDHVFAVRAFDAARNSDPSPADHAWLVDTTAPDTVIVRGPRDGTTRVVTFEFTATEPATFLCVLDGTSAPCTSPLTTSELADGTHTFAVFAIDAHGVTDPSPATVEWFIDGTPPTLAIDRHPSDPSNDTAPTFEFSSTDLGARFECSLDTAAFSTCTSPFRVFLAATAHTFAVRARDSFGNTSETASFAWTVDITAPTIAITDGPAGPTNDSTPTFTFTGDGSLSCRVDTTAFVPCSDSFTSATLGTGAHVFEVLAVDAAGNSASARRNFSIDLAPPTVFFDQAPPPQNWPVNYFVFRFRANETATFACSLNDAEPAPCSGPVTVTTGYNADQLFSVRATDLAGNTRTASVVWRPTPGLALRYTYQHGSTANSSGLAQVPSLSPGGFVTVPAAGGWAGTAAASTTPAHTYAGTKAALTSSADYVATVWIRPFGTGSGTIWRNATATDGIVVSYANRQVTLEVRDQGATSSVTASAPNHEWYSVAVRALEGAGGVELWLNGDLVGTAPSPSNGFTDRQSNNLVVGPLNGLAIDELRFHNVSLTAADMCRVATRGVVDATTGACLANRPAYELAIDHGLLDTGFFHLPLTGPTQVFFVGMLGFGLRPHVSAGEFALIGPVAASLATLPERSFTMWVETSTTSVDDTVIDFSSPSCGPNADIRCGMSISYVATPTRRLQFSFITSTGLGQFFDVPIAPGKHSIVVTEQRTGGVTQSVTIYVDGGVPKVLVLGEGELFTPANDKVRLPGSSSIAMDEYQLWPRDLSRSAASLCENGFDGVSDAITGACTLPAF